MDKSLSQKLLDALAKIDRPGSFCVQGSVPALMPGLEVKKVGPIGLPLTVKQAKELKEHCEQAPYGKGTRTLVDTSVRRVWRLPPSRFTLTNPEWGQVLDDMVSEVQAELGLEKRQLEAHLYELLLYERGSFFLPHKDGEKLDRMVATLVIVLPSAHEGGELVIRHDGREKVFDLGSGDRFRIHFAAFYADCEHEVRPLRKGYRLCLVYNLTLAKGKKGLKAPRAAEHIDKVSGLLSSWAQEPAPGKLVITLGHEYTAKNIGWDTLKGVDRAVADVVAESGKRAGCRVYLGLLTCWESGSGHPVGGYDYDRRGRWYDEDEEEEEADQDSDEYVMEEVFDESLSATHATDRAGKAMPFDTLWIDEADLLDQKALRAVQPEEDFEGYTGNAGMTLERWYRHAALILWPEQHDFDVICDQDLAAGITLLKTLVARWRKAGARSAPALREPCIQLARAVAAHWTERSFGHGYGEKPRIDAFFGLLLMLDEPALIRTYLSELMPKDVMLDPGTALAKLCAKHGWQTFEPELRAVFGNTSGSGLLRSTHVLEHLALARPRKDEGWSWLCEELGQLVVTGLERLDVDKTNTDWRMRTLDRKAVLPPLVRALAASNQPALLLRLVTHLLADPDTYPLIDMQFAVLSQLEPWLKKNMTTPSAGLAHWLAACREQLEEMTAQEPQRPADFRRPANSRCKCRWCAELNRFLAHPDEEAHRFTAPQSERSHLEDIIRRAPCDVDVKTERTRPTHTLVCSKNTKSYEVALKKYRQDRDHLARLRKFEAQLPVGCHRRLAQKTDSWSTESHGQRTYSRKERS